MHIYICIIHSFCEIFHEPENDEDEDDDDDDNDDDDDGDADAGGGGGGGGDMLSLIIIHQIVEGSLEVKLPTIWTVEKQR